MSSEGIQITIPDFDDDEYSAPNLFGKPSNPFSSASATDSPTSTSAPIPFGGGGVFHARNDSATSEDSSYSSHYPQPQASTSAGSSTGGAGATNKPSKLGPGAVPRKTSLASLRNAFKSSKGSEQTPPLPPLRNPFGNRSTTSLASLAQPPLTSTRRPSTSQGRPPTPGAKGSARSHHAYGRSGHSHNGSYFHGSSDMNTDFGPPPLMNFGFSARGAASPPPVPPVPAMHKREDSLDAPVAAAPDPRTPSDYALHAVFMRFATSAEVKIDMFLRQPLDREPLLTEHMALGLDTVFDELLSALGQIARRHAKPVIDSIMRWRKANADGVPTELVRLHTAPGVAGAPRGHQHNRSVAQFNAVSDTLAQRKSLASIYIMCRALIVVVQAIAQGTGHRGEVGLPENTGYMLEEITFEPFRRPDVKLLAQSANYRTNTGLFAKLLGDLANMRFVSVTDRFIAELGSVASGQKDKDADMRYATLLQGLDHIRIKTFPPEKFDEGAEFLESLAHAFDNAHGFGLKSAFAETLVHLLHPIGKTAEAEVNHPQWEKAMSIIYPKAKDMMSKPRYWAVAYPLVITCLCVAPRDYFLKHWMSCFDAGLAKLKEKPFRLPVMNGMMRLIWTYLYRCHEPLGTTTSKLDTLLKHFFPHNRLTVFPPPDDYLEPFVYITHFVLSRHHDFGVDFVLEQLVPEAGAGGLSASSLASSVSADRLAIAVQAVLLTLHAIEREAPVPTWPSSSDFSSLPPSEDYPSGAGFAPDSSTAPGKSGMQDQLLARLGPVLGRIAVACRASVGRMTIFDDQWALAQHNISYEDTPNYVIRRHPEGSVFYPVHLSSQMSMLQTCYRAWPRLLPPAPGGGLDAGAPNTTDALDMLVCGIVHVEPGVADVASLALRRFMAEPTHASVVLARYAAFLFETVHKTREAPGIRLVLESARLGNMWVSLLDGWIHVLLQTPVEELEDRRKDILARIDEIETGALFLLAHSTWSVHAIGVKVIRLLHILTQHLQIGFDPRVHEKPTRILDLIMGANSSRPYLSGFDEFLDRVDAERLEQWRALPNSDVLLRIADSPRGQDRSLWKFIYPAFLQACAAYPLRPLGRLRDTFIAAASRHHPFMSNVAASTRGRSVTTVAQARSLPTVDTVRISSETVVVVNQWAVWMKIICSITGAFDGRVGASNGTPTQHARAPSELSAEREKMMSARGLYRYLAQFLESEHTLVRNVAALCISHLPAQGYAQLLEDLGLLVARQFHDGGNASAFVARALRHADLYTAVARIYYLTAHHLRDARLPGRLAALSHVLKFVRQTQGLLASPDVRDQYHLQRLRRYFCGTAERLFDGLATLKDADRFVPVGMHLALYRLCEEWCQFGNQSAVVKQRLIFMQTQAATWGDSPQAKADSIERFQTQTKKLSKAAVSSLASLCYKAYFPPEITSGSPTEQAQDYLRPLDPVSTLDRLTSILASYDEGMRAGGNKALRLLLSRSELDIALADDVIRRAFVISNDADTSSGRFFKIVSDVICNSETNAFSPGQVVCLGLSNLCHPVAEIRLYAFRALDAVHRKLGGTPSIGQYAAGVNSSSPATYLRAYRLVSNALADAHAQYATVVLAQIAVWLPKFAEDVDNRFVLLLLQSLEYWVSDIELMTEDRTAFSKDGNTTLCHLMTLTLRFIDSHAEQILALWIRIVDPPHQFNGHATIRFLLEQSQKVGNSAFAACASKIVACLCDTSIGRQLYEELCSIIDPARILPNLEHKLHFPNEEDADIWSNLAALFADEPRLALGTGQFALLFLSDVALERSWEMQARLPVLLHALVTHLDHRQPYVRERVRYMLLQLVRSWLPAYEELDLPPANPEATSRNAIAELEDYIKTKLWEDDESSAISVPKIAAFCCKIVDLLSPLAPRLASQWGSIALTWATGCAVRSIAFRSLQVFRGIMPEVSKDDLGILIGRLSNTVSGTEEQLQGYTVEILLTLSILAESPKLKPSLLPQLFWCAFACLSTTVEREFIEVLSLLEAILGRIDLDDPTSSDSIYSARPANWNGPSYIQPALLSGLRSSATSPGTLRLLQRLAAFEDDLLIDDPMARVRTLYAVVLPWCLQDMSSENRDPKITEFAERIAELAEREEERSSLGRILTSFAKSRFRTKDDFLRQSVMTLKEQFGVDHWTELVTILMSLILNKERWLRVQTLQILKVLFQQKTGARNPVELNGSELLMPLLRLVESDVATQALDVLEEPVTVSGGLAAKHVLRMSMHLPPRNEDIDVQPVIFGIPEESGWCVAQPEEMRITCRANVEAVFDTCKTIIRPSRIDFHPEFDTQSDADTRSLGGGSSEAIGDLVQDLHNLSSFFQHETPNHRPAKITMDHIPSQQSVAKWAAILAKSGRPVDSPQTPFIDVFRVDTSADYSDISDEDTGSETESDHFIFDSPAYHSVT